MTVDRAAWFNGANNGVEPFAVPFVMLSIPEVNESVIKEQVRRMEQKKGFKSRGLNVTAKRKEVEQCCALFVLGGKSE